jgi:hypothetical protein
METYRDNLHTTSWLGEVVDVNDPLKIGRIRAKVFGKFDELNTEDIPWATPATSWSGGSGTGGGSFSVPKKGSIVAIQFNNGDLYHPEYRFNQNLSKEVKDLIKDSYTNAHVVVYDTVTDGGMKVYFTEKDGLMIDYKSTKLNIKPDNSISIKNPNGDEVEMKNNGNITINVEKTAKIKCMDAKIVAQNSIHLDCSKAASIKLGSVATNSIILGEPFLALFNAHVHVGNLMYPTSPPITPAPASLLSLVSKTQ